MRELPAWQFPGILQPHFHTEEEGSRTGSGVLLFPFTAVIPKRLPGYCNSKCLTVETIEGYIGCYHIW